MTIFIYMTNSKLTQLLLKAILHAIAQPFKNSS